jgi:hypothetical protein
MHALINLEKRENRLVSSMGMQDGSRRVVRRLEMT